MNALSRNIPTLLVFVAALPSVLAQTAQAPTNASQNYLLIPASTNFTDPRKPVPSSRTPTNGVNAITNQVTRLSVDRTMRVVPGGAVADFARHKLSIAADAAASRPIKITAPDGRTLSCRPSFIALYNAKSGQSLLLGAVTNRIGTVVLPSTVWWTNCFDTIRGDLRVAYFEQGLHSDILLREAPELPPSWRPEDVRIEIWSEWFDSELVSKEIQSIDLREDVPDAEPLRVPDEILDSAR